MTYIIKTLKLFVVLQLLQLALAFFGALFLLEHAAGVFGYALTLQSPISFHEVVAPTLHLAAR